MCATFLSLFELLITTASLSGDRLADRSPQPSKSADPPWSSRPSSRLALRRSKSLCVQANGDRPRCRSPRIPEEPEESCTGAQPRLISHLGEATASYCACRLTWIRRIEASSRKWKHPAKVRNLDSPRLGEARIVFCLQDSGDRPDCRSPQGARSILRRCAASSRLWPGRSTHFLLASHRGPACVPLSASWR